jgi:hypothetical protein
VKPKYSQRGGERSENVRKSSNSALGHISDRRHHRKPNMDMPQKLQEIKEFPDADLKKTKSFNPNQL